MLKFVAASAAALSMSACAMHQNETQSSNFGPETDSVWEETAAHAEKVVKVGDEPGLSAETQTEIDALNKVVSVLIDAEEIYGQAAKMPDEDPRVSESLTALWTSTQSQVETVQERVVALGGEADEAGEALGTGHRAFAVLRTMVDEDTDVALEEVLRGERYLVETIESAMEDVTSTESKTLLAGMKAQVQADIASLETLEQSV